MPIIQENIIEGNWVDILGSQSILLLKNSINFDYMENHQEWFDKMNVKESFLNGQKNFWHLLFKNDFLKTFLCYSDYGILINSGEFDGLTSQEAKTKIVEKVGGKMKSQYKLREWVFARQRYWGEPFPIVFDENHKSYAVADSELPVVLPQVDDYEPTGTGESPLANIKEFTDVYGYINTDGEFESVNGIHSEREINTIKYYTDQEQDYFTNTVHEEKDIYEDVKSELDYIGDKFKGSRTLEIGSAFCRDAKYLRNKGVDIVCSDISDIFSSYSDYNNFEFLNIDPTTSEIGVKVYDNVVALASLLHSENNNLKKIIKKINIATKDGGYIYLRMQNGEGEEFKNNKGGERFFNLVNESSISGILVESGYEVERVTYSHEDGKTPKKWINVLAKKVEHFEAKLFRRETNTMPQWAGSSWYYLRFIDPHNNDTFVDKNKEAKWSPVDFYVGGAEHATRHLIYARFWHKFLFDLGLVSTDEPFLKLQTVGLIMAEDGRKMSKRWGNIINPDDIIREYGADTLRLYEMFMGPFDQAVAWNTSAMSGVKRFLERFVRLSEKVDASATLDKNLDYFLNLTIKKVTEDIEKFKFNTAISQMMILLNEAEKYEKINSDFYLKFVKIISPFTPFLAEELYADMAFTDKKISIREEAWPLFDVSKLEKDLFVYAVQVNGKLRGEIEVSKDMSKEDILQLARSQENVKKWLDGETVKKEILIEGKLVNFVI
jgi:leucyl-tRNA synthetase